MTVPLNILFRVFYGTKLDFNKMTLASKSAGGINFVGRSSERHGISGVVESISGLPPIPAGAITVALGGSKLLASFVQLHPFYTAQNVAVLQPHEPMTMAERIYVCLCIRHNRFRYTAFGREANRTLRTLPIPDRSEFPEWLKRADLEALNVNLSHPLAPLTRSSIDFLRWRAFRLSDLFDIRKGTRLTQDKLKPGNTPFISAIDGNNGIRQRISSSPLHRAGLITVNYNGSVGEAFYQPEAFFASDDVNVLYPRFEMDEYIALFFCTIIKREKYKFNYGRKWNQERMKETIVHIPVQVDGAPDWDQMRAIIRSVPYSGAIRQLAASSDVTPPAANTPSSSG